MGCLKLNIENPVLLKVLNGGNSLVSKSDERLYRYGYNGMEKDDEVSGSGNSYTTEFRQYDPRLGRWKSLDPLMMMFPHMSPYCAFDNNPVYYTDPYGLSSEAGDGGPLLEELDLGDDKEDPVTIKGEKSCASDDYKSWYKEKGGSDFYRGVLNTIYEQKLKACDNGLGRAMYGRNVLGEANLPDDLKARKLKEAEEEVVNAIHCMYAMEKSGIDPRSANYMFNPFARALYLRQRARAVSSRGEAWGLLSGVALECAISWVGSGSLKKGPKFELGLKYGRAAYRLEVGELKNIVKQMRLAKCSSEEIARKVHQMRRDIGIKYKNLTDPVKLEEIYGRNLSKYEDKLGPSIEWLINKGKSWEDIIESACRTGGKDLGF